MPADGGGGPHFSGTNLDVANANIGTLNVGGQTSPPGGLTIPGPIVANSLTIVPPNSPNTSDFPAGATNILTSGTSSKVYDKGGAVFNVAGPKYRAIGTWDPVAGTGDAGAAITQAINDANTAGGVVFFPPGIYLTSVTLPIYTGTHLQGAGGHFNTATGQSAILPTATLATELLLNADNVNGNFNMAVKDLVLSTSTGTNSITVSVTASGALSRGFRLERCTIRAGTSHQVQLSNCQESWILDNYVLGNGSANAHCFNMVSFTDSVCSGNSCASANTTQNGSGFNLTGASGYNFFEANFAFLNDLGFFVSSAPGNVYNANRADSNYRSGFYITDNGTSAYYSILTANLCKDNGGGAGGTKAGIYVTNNTTGWVITANVCIDTRAGGARTQQVGLWVDTTVNGCVISGNIAANNVTGDFLYQTTGINLVYGNYAADTTIDFVLKHAFRRSFQAVALNGGTVTIDVRKGEQVIAALTASTTIAFSNEGQGQELIFEINHDATGTAFVLTWPANVKFAGGAFGTTKAGTDTANSKDSVTLFRDSTNWVEKGRALAVA